MSVPASATGTLIDLAADARPAWIADLLAPAGSLLVIAPHPDDETLGCGAAIVAALVAGVAVTVALLTDGGASHPQSRSHPPDVLMALRRHEFAAALAALADGARRPGCAAPRLDALHLGLADAAVAAGIDGAVETLRAEAARRDVGTIWCTSRLDPHADHVAAATIADALGGLRRDFAVWSRFGEAGRPLPGDRVRRFELEPHAAAKRAAMAAYASQLTPLIADDPDGFVMPAPLVDHFATAPEIFIVP